MGERTDAKREWHPNGQIKEETFYSGILLANGWSYKAYYSNGQLQQQQCYSHGQLIEQQTFNEQGYKVAHTIWNHRLQQMVNRPLITPARQTTRPNIANGCMTIDSIAEILPLAAELIETPTQSAELLAAHNAYYGYADDNDSHEGTEKSEEAEYWTIKGRKGSFTVTFERHEGYLFYNLHTPDNDDYEKAHQLIDRAQKRNRVYRYYSEESVLENAAKTGKPILLYIAPYHNKACLEWELAVWGTEPVNSLLINHYIFYSIYIEQGNENGLRSTSILESLQDWKTLIEDACRGNVFYIIQPSVSKQRLLLKNPTPSALEDFLIKHKQP